MNPELPVHRRVPWPPGSKHVLPGRANNFTCDNIGSCVQKGALESWAKDITEKQVETQVCTHADVTGAEGMLLGLPVHFALRTY